MADKQAWVKPDFIDVHLAQYRTDPDKAHYMDLSAMGIKEPVPALLLTTIGRKSGQPKVTPLNYQAVDGNYVVIASKGGYADHPLWYKNLDANPDVEVQAGTRRLKARARTSKGEERARLWEVMRRAYPPYDDYQAAAGEREIPVVVLEPTG
jgi:deazaflavin-dependent oxidoreductase (nitroreductase family)